MGHCRWKVPDLHNQEQKLKGFQSPPSPPQHVSFQKATNSGWLSLMLHPILLSQLLCRKIENYFHGLISVPGKGKRGLAGYLRLPGDNETLKAGSKGRGAATADPAECLQGPGKEVGRGRGPAQPTENIIAPGVGCCKQEGCGQDLSAAAILLMPPIPTAFDQQANGILCPEINAWSEGVGGYGRG